MLFSLEKSKKLTRRFRGLGKLFHVLSPGLQTNLIHANLEEVNPDEYRIASLFSALFYGIISFVLITALLFFMYNDLRISIILGMLIGIGFSFMVFYILLIYPKIIAGKQSEQIDKDLVYALKDLLLSISSGLSMFTSLTLVAKGSYGYVAKDIQKVVDKVNTGVSLEEALENLNFTEQINLFDMMYIEGEDPEDWLDDEEGYEKI